MSGEGENAPVVDEPPGKDGYQGQNPDTPVPPVPDYAPGTNPPGTNPPVPAASDPATTLPPGTHPVFPTDGGSPEGGNNNPEAAPAEEGVGGLEPETQAP